MLKLSKITKVYGSGDTAVEALKGVSVDFRTSDFVSILGPSGCGKTTLLNIIGGLDHYTEGDLVINGKSTKDFNDRDWDGYRNHSVGFVFQNYNLIPHQTVLQNVEIALALSGVSKAERRARAKEALSAVGLESQLHKKPSQMSGGQMQRVAIARALVNNPDIILADEPTGALDSETSVQVMEILKEVSKDRLVIMVTHNPTLAETYSTRIIRMLDGEIVDDSAPLTKSELKAEIENERKIIEDQTYVDKKGNKKIKKQKKPSMSLKTAFTFSLKNLISKKARTMLTSFAGSIGIIGIALILAVSQGMTAYIDFVQEETLSSYPLTLEAEHTDMGSLMQAFIDSAKSQGEHDKDAVYEKTALADLVEAMNSREVAQNDLASFKTYLEAELLDETSDLYGAVSGVQYGYDFDLLTYTKNADGVIIKSDTTALMMELISKYLGAGAMMDSFSGMSSNMPMGDMITSTMRTWQELLPGSNGEYVNPVLDKQYELVGNGSRWPNAYDEVVIVLDENNEIDDMTLYALGLKSGEEIDEIVSAAISGSDITSTAKSWSYEEVLGLEFKVILNSDCYQYDSVKGVYVDKRESNDSLRVLYDTKGIDLKVVGIVRPRPDSMSNMLTGNICYTSALTRHVVTEARSSEALTAQLDSRLTDVFTGLPFKEGGEAMTEEEKANKFQEYLAEFDFAKKAEVYTRIQCIPTAEYLAEFKGGLDYAYPTREAKTEMLANSMASSMGMSASDVEGYLNGMTDEDFAEAYSQFAVQAGTAKYAEERMVEIAGMSQQDWAMAIASMENYTEEQRALYYDSALTFSKSSYEENLRELGYVDLDEPSKINLYATSFENKDLINYIIKNVYNVEAGEDKAIKFTDYVSIMMSGITTIIDVITYVLIAFVAISLVVSSIMIGVITLISVQERTKEIGILRALGASKRNVSSMFNAETVIIGFASGALGAIITYLLCIPINLILHAVTGIGNLNAFLPFGAAVILTVISVVLTLIAGIIPSRSAAKKDPAVAFRAD